MEQTFERIEKHLYKCQYETSTGQLNTRYYGIFIDWKGKRRNFPLGEDRERARDKLGDFRRKNDARFDFDQDQAERTARELTFSKWVARCSKSESDKRHLKHLEPVLGDIPVSQIDDERVKQYREKRTGEKIIRHKKESKKLVSQTTINKELSTLRKYLRLARKKGFVDKVTEFPMAVERARKRILTEQEYKTLLEKSPAWLRRACVMAWETCLSRSDLLSLTWEEIDVKEGIIELKENRAKTGVEQAIPIMTPELQAVITELQAERRKLPNVDGLVLTIEGKPIDKLKFEYWFRRVRGEAGIKNFTFHDFRHCAITRWAAAGIPTAAAMLAAGHKSVQSHKKYQNLQRDQLKNAFQIFYKPCTNENEGKGARSAS